MAKLRHFALAVRDLEKSAAFYENVFGLKRVGREDLEIGSGVYLSDGESKDKVNFERKFKDPDGIIFDISERGWLGTEEQKR